MGFFTDLEGRWPPPPHDDFWYSTIGRRGDSGIEVTPENAITYTAVWGAIQIVAGTLGSLPAILYRHRDSGHAKDRATDHPLFALLRWQPNPWQTAMDFFQGQQENIMLRGNAVSWVQRTRGRVSRLIPWHPDRVQMELKGDTLWYHLLRQNGGEYLVPMEDIWHVRGPFCNNGLWAISPIAAHAQALGYGMAAEAYGARFFKNDTTPGGVLEHPGTLQPNTRKNLEESWAQSHGGVNQHRVAVLEEGMTWRATSVTPQEAQAIETLKWNVTDVARIYNVPVHLLKELSNSHFNNVTEQNLEMVRDTVRPVATRWEQQAARTFFPQGAGGLELLFDLDALLRGDPKARAEKHEIEVRSGMLTLDEWRAEEGRNPHEDAGVGSAVWVPVNWIPAEQALAMEQPGEGEGGFGGADEDEGADDPLIEASRAYLARRGAIEVSTLNATQVRSLSARIRLREVWRKVLVRAAQLVIGREVNNMRRAVTATEGDPEAFRQRIASFYDKFEATARTLLRPHLEAFCEQAYAEAHREAGGDGEMREQDVDACMQYVATAALRHVSASRGQLEALSREEGWEVGVRTRLDEWEERRAAKMADRERVQGESYSALLAYAAMQVIGIRWVTFGENCPLCTRLNGRVVGTQSAFLGAGETLVGDEDTRLTPRRVVRHAPLHQGCDCAIAAEN